MFTTYTEAETRAKALGAVKVGTYNVKKDERFSAHFFNSAGLEIGYYIYGIGQPLHELEHARKWHESLILGLEFSEVQP